MSQDEKGNKSEVARIRAQIAAESEAAQQALHGLAQGVSQHEFITARMENMSRLHDRLKEIDEDATEFLVETLQASADAAERSKKGKE